MLTEQDVTEIAPFVRAIATRRERPDLEAKDVEQDIWLALLELKVRFKRHWGFIGIVANRAANRSWRRIQRNKFCELLDTHRAPGSLDRQIDAALLMRRMADLPKRSREAALLFYRDDLPEAEIAQRIGINEHTAQSRVSFATRKIRQQINL
jgi:RNA polymerase sigma factor (sigma-70 family)